MGRGAQFLIIFFAYAWYLDVHGYQQLMLLVPFTLFAIWLTEASLWLVRGFVLLCAMRPAFFVQFMLGTAFLAGSWYFIGSPFSVMQDLVALMEHHQQANAATNDEPRWETTP